VKDDAVIDDWLEGADGMAIGVILRAAGFFAAGLSTILSLLA
jgi:hypothetical protein